VLVYSSTPVPAGAAAALRVGAILGRRFKRLEDGRYSGGPFYFSADGAQISMNLDPARGPELFRQSAAAAWDVLRSAVLGAPVQIDESTRRNFLGVGHRLASLAQVSSDMDIDGAEAALRALFPSVKRDGASFSIELDHPWFDWARLELENAAHGRFEGLTIGPFGSGTPAEQEAVAQCLTTVLGEPEVRETDHVAGTHSWSWGHVWKNDYVHTVQRLVMISIRKDASDPPRDRASLERIFTQLDTCGRN